MLDPYDVIIIGAGVMGSAAAYHLAKDGRRVLLLEQFDIGHVLGSSHGETRLFRFAYPNDDYAKLAMQCKPMWRALEADSGEQLFIDHAHLDIATEPDYVQQVQQVAETLGRVGAQFEVLNAVDVRARYPQWQLAESAHVVLSHDSGILRASRCVQTLVRQAAHHSATVRDHEPVTHIYPDATHVEVVTAKARYRTKKVVVAGGAWINTLLQDLGVQLPLDVTQEQTVYFQPRTHAEQFVLGRFPIFVHWREQDSGFGFPILDTPGVKIGFHYDKFTVNPNDPRQARDSVTHRLHAYVARFLPDLAGATFQAQTCLYTTTPDEDFVIDIAPTAPNVIVCSACSGHGFKFGIGIGRALADLVQHGATDMHIGHVRMRAFQR